MHTPATCTVRVRFDEQCGEPAVWSNGEFAECAKHAADLVALARATKRVFGYELGDTVEIRRYGRVYEGTVVKVGARGAVWADFEYGNGAKRTVRVDS